MTEQLTEKTDSLAPDEVRDFVARVREHLADLDADEQQELTAGLEADLADLVSERGTDALGEPAAYARELRSAAGHVPVTGRASGGRGVRHALMEAIDTTHDTWDRVVDSISGDLRPFLTALQPAWWVLRAGVAWMVAQDIRGNDVVADWTWLAVLAVFVVVSVQLGRRAWRLDRLLAASVLARLLLVGLNIFAVTMLPGAVDRLAWHIAEERAWQLVDSTTEQDVDNVNPNVITYQGSQACVIEVRDANDEVIPNAQVWDVTGDRPLPMATDQC